MAESRNQSGAKALYRQLGGSDPIGGGSSGGSGTDPTKMPLAGGTFTGWVEFNLGAYSLTWLGATGNFTADARLITFENTSTANTSSMGVELVAGSGLGSRISDAAPEYTVETIYTGRLVQENFNDGFTWHAIEPTGDYRWYVDSAEVMRIGGDNVLYIGGVDVLGDINTSITELYGATEVHSLIFAQTAHGFTVGAPIYNNAGTWTLADSDTSASAAVGVVSDASNPNIFVVVFGGTFSLTTAEWDAICGTTGGLTAGARYYLSSTAGQLTATAPTTGKQRVIVGLSSTTALVCPDEPFDASGGGTWGSITGTLSDQTDLQTALDASGSFAVHQVAHALVRGKPIYMDSASGQWLAADPTDLNKAAVALVLDVTDADNFVAAPRGVATLTAAEWDVLTGEGTGDPYFANVASLLHLNGADNSTTFTDTITGTFTRTGNTVIKTAQSKFGGASAYFDGAGDYLSRTLTSGAPGTGDFTLEAWVKPAVGSAGGFFGFVNGIASNDQRCLLFISGTATATSFSMFGLTQAGSGTGKSIAATHPGWDGGWVHVVFQRRSGLGYIYTNGVLRSTAGDISNNITTNILRAGVTFTAGATAYFTGYIDECRYTKGVARYTADFTPPGVPFPDSAGTATGLTQGSKYYLGPTVGAVTTNRPAGGLRQLVFTALNNTDALLALNDPEKVVGLVYSTAAGGTVANTAVETAFSGFSYTIPANSSAVGDVYDIELRGKYSSKASGPGTLTLKLKSGSTTLWDSGAITLTAAISNLGWSARVRLLLSAIGVSGAAMVAAEGRLAVSTSSVAVVLPATASVGSIDYSGAQALTLTATWSVADATNTITLDQAAIEHLGVS